MVCNNCYSTCYFKEKVRFHFIWAFLKIHFIILWQEFWSFAYYETNGYGHDLKLLIINLQLLHVSYPPRSVDWCRAKNIWATHVYLICTISTSLTKFVSYIFLIFIGLKHYLVHHKLMSNRQYPYMAWMVKILNIHSHLKTPSLCIGTQIFNKKILCLTCLKSSIRIMS